MKNLSFLNLYVFVFLLFFMSACSVIDNIKACKNDKINWVSAKGECLRVLTKNPINKPKALIVFLHGDGSRGGPSDYLAGRSHKVNPAKNNFVVVNIIRPGYFDSDDNYSTGYNNNRSDNYTKDNIDIISNAISNLKKHYQPQKIIIAGHSGGAAITGNIIGLYPDLIDGVVLAACPCNVPLWRATRSGGKWLSLSPSSFVTAVKKTKVIVIAGDKDTNTFPSLMENYIDTLKSRGVNAEYILLANVSHNGTARANEFFSSIIRLAL